LRGLGEVGRSLGRLSVDRRGAAGGVVGTPAFGTGARCGPCPKGTRAPCHGGVAPVRAVERRPTAPMDRT
jgi:hypothetical protein